MYFQESLESSVVYFGDNHTVNFRRSSLRSFQRDMRASLRRDFVVLLHGLGADGALGRFILLLVKLDDE